MRSTLQIDLAPSIVMGNEARPITTCAATPG